MERFFASFQIAVLILFLFVFVGRTLYLRIRRGVRVFALGVGKSGWRRVLELSFFVGLVLWIAAILLYALNQEARFLPAFLNIRLLDSNPLGLAGTVLIVLGLALFVWALISFGHSWRVGIDQRMQGDLVTGGAFALSRNPIFLFIDLYFVGTFLINGTLVFLLFALLVIVGLHYQIVQEERFLTEAYGQAYEDYCARTGRYLAWRSGVSK
jgi:protein-S-isoprenylcysteine O-methyltransferase Ste14